MGSVDRPIVYPTWSQLETGDILLKDQGSPINWFTKVKTWSEVSHCELLVRGDWSGGEFGPEPQVITAFPKGGVGVFDLTFKGLVYILRPRFPLGKDGIAWFLEEALDQKYDMLGQLSFFLAQWQGADNGRQFCSEVIARIFKKDDFPLLAARLDCDAYAPASFLKSPLVDIFWARPGAKWLGEI